MPRPLLEVADLVRSAGWDFIEHNRRWLNRLHVKVLTAIERCRTAALGGHLDACVRCGHRVISFNSCRDRHCPKCQANARDRWLQARERELLPTRYAHVVFTLPHELGPLTLQNKKVVYDLLFRTSAQTLMEIARDPQHLGAEIGFFSVLHTWNQKLEFHPHIHCVVPAGGLSADHSRWVTSQKNFFLPVEALSEVFSGNSPRHCAKHSSTVGSVSTDPYNHWSVPKSSRSCCVKPIGKSGSSMPSGRLAERSTPSAISAATRIEWLSLIIGSLSLKMIVSRSAGAIQRTEIRSGS
jgi:Transposase zinc-binding domain/Putative transposase